MIESITIRNFKSILDLTMDFTYAEAKAPNGWRESEWLPFVGDGDIGRFVPILAIYGANASGKSNLLDALRTFQLVVLKGIEWNYHPNRLVAEAQSAATELIMKVNWHGKVYVYEFSYDKTRILREKLYREDVPGQKIFFALSQGELLEANLGNELYFYQKLREIARVECCDGHGRQTKSFLYSLFKGYAGLSEELNIVAAELLVKNFICRFNDILVSSAIDRLIKSGNAEDAQTAFGKILAVLKKYDLQIDTMKLNRETIPRTSLERYATEEDRSPFFIKQSTDGEQVTVEHITSFHRRTDGVLEPFNFYTEESQGTKILAGLIGLALEVLDKGGRLFVDELDRSLHPLLLVQFVRMFKSKKLNTKGAQLIFTLHETTLLEDPLLRLSEVGILNNNLYSGTTLMRLIDYHKEDKTVRNVHNFRKRYLEGLYAGIPNPIP